MGQYLMISDAAKEVNVESHVLRYWEEELHLPIKRNELGHRYYTEEDVECFKQIKKMKEKGLQLKAIKVILKDGKLNILESEGAGEDVDSKDTDLKHNGTMEREQVIKPLVEQKREEISVEDKEDKAKRLQWLLRQMIVEAIEANNEILCGEFRQSVLKELDYQFRVQEEKDEERERAQIKRSEEYYQRMDELLRKKSGKNIKRFREKYRTIDDPAVGEEKSNIKNDGKKKGHFFF